MLTTPFWTDACPLPANLPIPNFPLTVDVAIVGSGYTGLHTALSVARAGGTVGVLEAQRIGWGASSRNGGMLNPGLKLGGRELFHRFGPETGRKLWMWSLEAIDFVEEFVQAEGIACDFCRSGQIVLAHKPAHFTAMRAEVAWHADTLGDTVPELVGPAELDGEIGSPLYFGGIRDLRAAGLQPAKYVVGLAEAARRQGVQLVDQTPVTAITRRGDRYELQTPRGLIFAGEVLLATNGYTTGLVPRVRRNVFAGGSYIITTAPLSPDLQAAVSPRRRMFYDSKHFLNYFRLTADGRMLFGGRHNLSTDLDLVQSARELQHRMIQIFPQLAGVELTHSWTGKLGLTFDLMPHVGRVPSGPARGVHYALGYGGHGVGVASYLGHQLGKHLAGQPVEIPFFGLPHPQYFFTPYEKLYLPFVSAWFRFLDQVS